MRTVTKVGEELERCLFHGETMQAIYDGSGKDSTGRAWQRCVRGQCEAV